MGLTSAGPVLIAAALALAALLATGFGWRYMRGRWWPVRVVAVLGCEVLVLALAGFAVNRAGQFYPSWSSLLTPPAATVDPGRTPTLRATVLAGGSDGARHGVHLTWAPGPGLVWLPPAYFTDPTRAQPVVLVLADRDVLGPGTPAACVVTVHIGPSIGAARLARITAPRLVSDFGVARHGWAVVALGPAVALARQLVAADPVRFTALYVVARDADLAAARRAVAAALRTLPPALAPPVVIGPAPVRS